MEAPQSDRLPAVEVLHESLLRQLHRKSSCGLPLNHFLQTADGKQEAKSNKINLAEDDPAAVHAMIKYLYKQTYDNPHPASNEGLMTAFHVHVHNIADKYDVAGLQEQALMKFKPLAETFWSSHRFGDIIEHVVKPVFGEGPPESAMRAYVTQLVLDHATELLNVKATKTMSAFEPTVASLSELTVKLVCQLSRGKSSCDGLSRYRCCHCEEVFAVDPSKRAHGYIYCAFCRRSHDRLTLETLRVSDV